MRFTINLLAVFLIFILAIPLSVSAAALEATSPSVNVLALPEPQISSIDAAKNIVHMSFSVDPDASADFRAGVMIEDGAGNVLEVSPLIAVTNPDNIQVPILTVLKAGDKITPEITNNNFKSTGEGGVHSEAPEAPSAIVDKPVIIEKTKTRTAYEIIEAAPDQVIIKKIVEVATRVPVVVNYNGLDNVDVQTETPTSDIVAGTPEAIKEVANVLAPSLPVPEVETNKSMISGNTKLILFFVISVLCVVLFGVNAYLTYVNHAGAAKLKQV